MQSSFEKDLQHKFPDYVVSPLTNTKHGNVLKMKDPSGRTFVAKTIWHDIGDLHGDMGIEVMDKRFRTEARILKMLPKWWPLRYHHHFKTKENRIIVTEEIPTVPWSSYKPTKKKNSVIAHELVKQLNWLHSKKIAHGDMELKNIMLTDEGLPVIIDFEKSVVRATKAQIHEDFVTLMLSVSEQPNTKHMNDFINQELVQMERKTRKNKNV